MPDDAQPAAAPSTSASVATQSAARKPETANSLFAPLAPDEMAAYVAIDGRLAARIVLRDVPRENAKRSLARLHELGVKELSMLTGDKAASARIIANEVGIDDVQSELFPEDKVAAVKSATESKHQKLSLWNRIKQRVTGESKNRQITMMVGDGVNDAPALASADVGIAIGAGTDVAIESADIVLMKNDLLDAVGAVKLSRAVIRNIKENLFWAFFYNSIGIPLAAGVLYPLFQIKLNPMFGAAAMSLSSVCVVSNALRLRWVKLHDAKKTQSEPHQDVAASTIADINQHNALDNNIKSTNNDKGESTMTTTISIEGMMCAHCQAHVEKALKEVAGVTEVTVSLENKNAVVTGDASVEALKQAVVDAGYEVTDVK